VGETGPGGGKVFYAPVDGFTESGAPCGSSCRYLEAAPVDWASPGQGYGDPSYQWGGGDGTDGQCSNNTISGAAGTGIGSGFAHTATIVADCPDPSGDNSAPAALAASTYAPTFGGVVVNGWFLPSLDELNLLDLSRVGGLPSLNGYWSSSQGSASDAWGQIVGYSGGVTWAFYQPKVNAWLVRPVRAF